MKYLLLGLGVFVCSAVNAQFGFFAKGGANYSNLRIVRGQGDQNADGGFGGQLGGGIEYHTQFGYILYGGIEFAKETFKKDSTGTSGLQTITTQYSYKPLFANFPIGIAYQFDFTKDMGLKLYGGLTVQVGVGGKVSHNTSYFLQDSGLVRQSSEEHKIDYGKNSSKEFSFDLANSNVGFDIGAGLNFKKSTEIYLTYHYGLKNILPGGENAGEVNRLDFLQLGVKLYFPKQYYSTKK